ncbi:MAG: sigma 54-interacting transcriptional regulator [Desulfamplus sp.]|nr:sigma 54-interacting transcriptional regulator [Desulfamplus sp.]
MPHDALSDIDFISLFDRLDDGVIITDKSGVILFYNSAQAKIDDLSSRSVLGLKVTDIYALNDSTSMIMQCINRKTAIKNRIFFYRTRSGKVANTITSVYPVFRGEDVTGAVCFVKDYEFLKKSSFTAGINECRPDFGNGSRFSFEDMITSNSEFQRGVIIARKAANSSSPIMLCGETGTGKELFAQSIHNHSLRNQKKYIAVNCAAIPDDLLEGLLFGTTKGAFTGAMDKPGLFEMANGGTLFLDELLAMPLNLQAKLLRVLQEKKVRRVGSLNETDINVKIISSVSNDPRIAIKNSQLRIDLFYRLGVVIIKIPPLRERRDAISDLVKHFIDKLNTSLGTHVKGVSDGVMALFMEYQWPGNVRELEHLIEGAMNLVGQEEIIDLKHFSSGFDTFAENSSHQLDCSPVDCSPENMNCNSRNTVGNSRNMDYNSGNMDCLSNSMNGHSNSASTPVCPLDQLQENNERVAVIQALEWSTGNVTKAAQRLGISRQLLHYKIKKHGLKRKHFL